MGDNKYHVGSVLVRNIGKYLIRIAGYVRRRYLEHHAGHRAIYIKTSTGSAHIYGRRPNHYSTISSFYCLGSES